MPSLLASAPITVPAKQPWTRAWRELLRWSMIRNKVLLPLFTAIQVMFALAVVFGFTLLSPVVTEETARYLASGAWTLGIIAVGCVMAPQMMSQSKQEGFLDYQLTLPVPRSAILLSDALVWGAAALPGIVVGMVAATWRFDLQLNLGLVTVLTILGVLFTAVCLGYAFSLWFPPNVSVFVTQIIIFGGTLFSPITFPAERLPHWAATMHQYLPFAPMGNLVRETTLGGSADLRLDAAVLLAWAVLGYVVAYLALRRRN